VLGGDYNVIPAPRDARHPEAWTNDALFLPRTRDKFQALLNLGLTDALRAVNDEAGVFTFWDYQAGAWQKNNGIRIDHLLLSPQAADRLTTGGVDKHVRAWEKPSDHVPVFIDLATCHPSPARAPRPAGRRSTYPLSRCSWRSRGTSGRAAPGVAGPAR
jgi:exodeoxyribonuclease III